jgi:hypothetical protein
VVEQEQTEEQTPKRNRTRDSLFLAAQLSVDSASAPVDIRIRNLSAGGMMMDCTHPLAKGQTVITHLRNIGEVAGVVAWASSGRCGVAFDVDIDPKLARLPVAPQKSEVPSFIRAPVGRRSGLKSS